VKQSLSRVGAAGLAGGKVPLMGFVVLTKADVERLLPMAACIEVMAEALVALHRGEMSMPLRRVFVPANATGLMVWMPAHRSGEESAYGMKVLSVIPDNPARGLDGHQGAVILQDGQTGQIGAIVDASAVTAIRTAAVTAVATRALAREDAGRLSIFGTGTQARRHLESIALVRPIERALVAGRTREKATAFVEGLRGSVPFPLDAASDAEAAVGQADIVTTVTTSREPVLRGAWLAPGTHVNAVGASQPSSRELDTEAVAGASLFADRRESVRNEAGEFRLAVEERAIGPDHVRAELAEVLTGEHPGRGSAGEITLFRSLGLAVEDLAAARFAVDQALRFGLGARVDF
jgi:ornithine cyclodeaminase/alanine dehydrogenase-like protein (mu-crystallin family)